jgi:hypothetical protein
MANNANPIHIIKMPIRAGTNESDGLPVRLGPGIWITSQRTANRAGNVIVGSLLVQDTYSTMSQAQ